MISKRNSTFCVRTSLSAIEIPSKIIEDTINPDIRLKRDINGNCIYETVGEIDIQNYINSFEAGCSLRDILSRCSLVPTEQKIRMLQQSPEGYSADIVNMPKDGTEAFILLNKIKNDHKDVFDRFAKGDSFESILKDLIPQPEAKTNDIKEDSTNG